MLTAGKKKIKARLKEPRSAVNSVADVDSSARLFRLRRRNSSVHLTKVLATAAHSNIARGKPSSTPGAGTEKHPGLRELEKVQQAQNRPDISSKEEIPSKWYYSFLSKIPRHQKAVDASTPVAVAQSLEPADSPTSQSPSALGTSIPSASTPNSALSINIDITDNNKVTLSQVDHPGPITQQFIHGAIQGSSENLMLIGGREEERMVGSHLNANVAKSSKSIPQASETGQQEHLALITPPGRALGATQEPRQPPQEAYPPQPPHRAGVGSTHNVSQLYGVDSGEARGLIGRDPNTDLFPLAPSSGAADSNLMDSEVKLQDMMGESLVAGASGEKIRVGRVAGDTKSTSDHACKGTSAGGTGQRDDEGRPSWDLAAAERAGVTLIRGMRVLCLDIFISKIGGGEVRRWRPAEIAQVFKEHADELVVRVDFFSYGDSTESICLRLRDDWTRLASALSLTEEEMIAGTPLEGDALNASRKLFKPRSNRRKSGQGNTTETSKPNKSAKPGSSETSSQPQRTAEAESSAQSGAAIVGSEGSRRRQPRVGNRSGSGGDEQREREGQGHGRSRRRRTGSDGGVPGGRGGLDKSGVEAERGAAAIAAAFVAALTAAKQVDSSDNGSESGSGKERRKMKGVQENQDVGRQQDAGGQQAPESRALVTSVSLPESLEVVGAATSSQQEVEGQTTSTAMTTARAPGSSSSKSRRYAPSGAASKASSRTSGSGGGKTSAGGSVSVSGAKDLGVPASSLIQNRRLRLSNGSADVPASRGGQVRGRGGGQRGWERQVGQEASAGTGSGGLAGALAAGGIEGTEGRKKQWTVWEMSRSSPPAIGDRFDCLDYFTSSQSLRSASRWREAEVGGVRYNREETRVDVEVLVHYVRWSDKWDRWISFTRERERFAPYMTRAVSLGATAGQSGSIGGSRRQQKEPRGGGGGGGSTSSSSNITFNGAHGGTYNGVIYGDNLSDGTSYPVGYGAIHGGHGVSYGDGSLSSGAVVAGAGHRNLTLPHGFTGGAGDAARGPPYGASKLLDGGQQGGGNNNSHNIDGVRHSSHPMGEGRGVNSSSSNNAGSGSGKSSSTTSSGGSGSRSSSGSGGVSVGNSSHASGGVAVKTEMCSPATSSQESTSEDDEASADALFREAMGQKGLRVIDVEPDGNCLFRSVSHQVFGDAERHLQVRAACVKHMTKHRARFGVFFAGNFTDHLFQIKQPAVWGDDLEIRALEELLDRPIEIYSSDAEDLRPMKIDFDAAALDVETAPIKLSYHGQSHYNSVRDKSIVYPLKPRRSKNILRMREAQHARTPRSSAADASGSSSSTGQDQGIRRPRGGGFRTEGSGTSSRRRSFGKDSRRFTGDSAPLLLGSSGVSKSEGVSKSGGGDGGGGGAANASNGSITKNFAGMVYRTMSRGGGPNRKSGGV